MPLLAENFFEARSNGDDIIAESSAGIGPQRASAVKADGPVAAVKKRQLDLQMRGNALDTPFRAALLRGRENAH